MLSSSCQRTVLQISFSKSSLAVALDCLVSGILFFLILLVGVWAQETIPVRTCFGPLIGQQSHSMEVADWTDKAANHIWKVSLRFFPCGFALCSSNGLNVGFFCFHTQKCSTVLGIMGQHCEWYGKFPLFLVTELRAHLPCCSLELDLM